MDRQSDREIADTLLIEWYRWAKAWRPNLGAPRISPYCQQDKAKKARADENRKDGELNETYEDDAYEKLHKREMEAVEHCVDTLAVPLQQAIGTEMRNREVNAKVWRSPSNRSYSDALHAAMAGMKKHDDLRQLFN